MKVFLLFIFGFACFSTVVLGNECMKNDVKGANRVAVSKMVQDANNFGFFTIKHLIGKDEIIKIGDKFRMKRSSMVCQNPEDCKVVGFCLGSKYDSAKRGIRGYQYDLSDWCVSVLVNTQKSPTEFNRSCFEIDDLERVK